MILRIIQEENAYCLLSLSAWRAWIEILFADYFKYFMPSLSAWRAWIEIETVVGTDWLKKRRSLLGERGLK